MKARIPADIDMADRIFAGLTARQLAILAVHGLVMFAIWQAASTRLPLAAAAVATVPVGALGAAWATAKVDGQTPERVARAALRFLRSPRRRVLAPEGITQLRTVRVARPGVAPLELPAREISAEGVVSLGADGVALIARASSINFTLRSEPEQQALIEAFARALNALDAPVQFVIRTEVADVRGLVVAIEDRAPRLAHRSLELAALEHAGFLRSLSARTDVHRRGVFVCAHDRDAEAGAANVAQRVGEIGSLLRGAGVRITQLESTHARDVLVRALDPAAPLSHSTDTDDVVTGRPS